MAKSILAGCLTALVLCSTAFGRTLELNGANDPALLSFRRSLAGAGDPGPGISAQGVSRERGIAASDAIRGNGTKAGYVLTHGGIVPNSDTVTVDGRMRSRNRDYYLDCSNGMLVFAEPVKSNQLVRVTYRYVQGSDADKKTLPGPALALNLGQSTKMGVLYAYQPNAGGDARNAFDLLTYGVNLNTTIGKQSSMSNMLYMSTPRDSGRVSVERFKEAPKGTPTPKPKADNLFVHSSSLQSGKLSLKASFQEVGADFAGFTAMRQQKAGPDAVLNQLEKEKGLRRLGVQADYNLGGGNTTGVAWSRIGDSGGDILKQSFTFGGERFKIAGSRQEIGEKFSRFKDLAEAERDQWAKERGITRSGVSLSLAPSKGMKADSPWNMLSMNTISDKSGKVTLNALNFTGNGFGLTAFQSKVDAGFRRIGDLTEDDRTQMALRIRQAFDPAATAANITPDDRKHAASEVGIARQNIMANGQLGSLALGMRSYQLNDGASGLSRQMLMVKGTGYSITGTVQEIDKDFGKLSMLSPVEKANFGNERGMKRTNLAGEFTLNPQLKLATSFSRVNAEDAGLTRYGMSLTGKSFSVKGNYRSIDPKFNRIMDLADGDRKQLASEQGSDVYDLTTHFQGGKKLTVDNYLYDARNSTSGGFRRQFRNNIVMTPFGDMKLTVFRDEVSSGNAGASSRSLHETYRLDHSISGIQFNAIMDNLRNTTSSGDEKDVRTKVLHFNTKPGKKLSVVGDWKNIQRDDGTYEDSQVLRLDTALTKSLTFKGMRSTVRTDKNLTVAQEYSVVGKVFGSLNLSTKFGETLVNGITSGKLREFSLSPSGPKDLGMFRGTSWSMSFAEARQGGRVLTQTKAAKVETNVVKHKLTAEYLGQVTKEGQQTIVRGFTLGSSPDPKHRLHYSLAYKIRDPKAGPSLLIRRYDADYRFSKSTKIEYGYFSFREQANGVLEPVGGQRLKLTTGLTKRLGLVAEYQLLDNYQQRVGTAKTSIGITGRVSSLGLLEFSYGSDRSALPGGVSASSCYKLKYDYQVSAEQFFTFSGEYVNRTGANAPNPGLEEGVRFTIDFRTTWD